jgi:hypothetical protein
MIYKEVYCSQLAGSSESETQIWKKVSVLRITILT